MATLLPPPTKRQRTDATEKARQQQDVESVPADLGSIRVQFFDQATGSATGPAVSVPVADATVKNLETLLNTLQGNVGTLPQCCSMMQQDKTNHFLCRRTMMNEYHTGSRINQTTKTTKRSIFLQIYTIPSSSPD